MATEKDRVVMHFRLTATLRARAEACAEAEGVSVTEFAREALRRRCEESERAGAGGTRYPVRDGTHAPGLLEVREPRPPYGVMPAGVSAVPAPSLPDGGRYEGEFGADGQPHGQGVMTWRDGTRYEGEWREGKPYGKGVLTGPDNADQ